MYHHWFTQGASTFLIQKSNLVDFRALIETPYYDWKDSIMKGEIGVMSEGDRRIAVFASAFVFPCDRFWVRLPQEGC